MPSKAVVDTLRYRRMEPTTKLGWRPTTLQGMSRHQLSWTAQANLDVAG